MEELIDMRGSDEYGEQSHSSDYQSSAASVQDAFWKLEVKYEEVAWVVSSRLPGLNESLNIFPELGWSRDLPRQQWTEEHDPSSWKLAPDN